MSFDDYAQHLAQKYRLAISIAILNIKPADLTIDEFMEQIKYTINEKNSDNIDILNLSACSDDFNIENSDDMNSDQNHMNHDQNHMNQHDHTNITDHNMNLNDQNITSIDSFNAKILVNRINIDNESTRLNDDGENDEGNATGLSKEYQKQESSMAIHLRNSDANKQRREKYRGLIKVLKEDVATDKIHEKSQFNLQYDSNDLDLTVCNTENGSIQIPQTGKHTDSFINKLSNKKPKKIRKRTNNEQCSLQSKITKNIHNNEIEIKDIENKHNYETIVAEKHSNMYETMKIVNDSCNLNLNTDVHKDLDDIDIVHKDINTQETIVHTETQNNTHYSQSQMNEVVISSHFIYGNKNTINVDFNKNNSKELELYGTNKTNDEEKLNKNANKLKRSTFLLNNQIGHSEIEIVNSTENDTAFQEYSLVDKESNIKKNTTLSQNIDLNIFKPSTNFNAIFENPTEKNSCTVLSNDCTAFDKTSETDTDEEKVPFKVIEEINRIKTFLRRKENTECSSGFKSQSKSFVGTPQCLWIGQSASTVLNFLCNCVLLTSTQHLTENISEVLGQLIDRLHEGEMYPIFLEDLLTTLDKMLLLLYEEENYTFDVLVKKEELIQRIILLTKSSHVQKFTIDKINNILQNLLDNVSADAMEIINVDKIENLCYIFQILQILLPKHNGDSQSTQNSQEKVLRKKDITDIWRKKWMEQKIDSNEGSSEEKCVLKECSAILNEIIINFMEGYSLIAFSALKCFNILQS